MNRTKIPWAKNPDGTPGYTWNPITGCLNHTNGMCKGGNFPCYAYRLAHTRLRERYLANSNTSSHHKELVSIEEYETQRTDPFYPRFWNDRLLDGRDELCGGKLKGIFVCDMSDLFGIGIPEEWTKRVLDVIESRPQHRFYLLTKQPQNLSKWSPFPDNCWVGQTITRNLGGIGYMADFEAKVKFISFEPLLYYNIDVLTASELLRVNGIKQVIIGGQTKPTRLPEIASVKLLVEAADKANVKVFLKENLKPLINYPAQAWAYGKYGDGVFTGLLRQEIPEE